MNEVGRIVTILVFAFIGWALCGAIMGIGRTVTSLENTLVVHAIGAPIIFAALSFVYFTRFNYTPPLETALTFLAFVAFMDVFLIALFVEKSFAMFSSILGTWIPFALIFLSTYLTGLYLRGATQVIIP
jgi:hypothetical protein